MIGSNFDGARRRHAAGAGSTIAEGALDEMVALAAAQALRLAAEVEPNGSFALLTTEIANELEFVVLGKRPAPERAVPTFPWDDFNAWMREQGS